MEEGGRIREADVGKGEGEVEWMEEGGRIRGPQ